MDQSRDIVIAGSDSPFSLASACQDACESLGHSTTLVDIVPATIPIVNRSFGIKSVQSRLINTVAREQPDLVFIIKGEKVRQDTLETIHSEVNTVIVNWNPDNPFRERSEARQMETFLEAVPEYDRLFIWTEKLFDPLTDNGAERVELLPFGYVTDLHQSTKADHKYDSSVIFLGHWSKKRQRYLTPLAENGTDISIYGGGWKRHCFDWTVRRQIEGGPVTGEEYSVAMCSADVVLNIVADHNLDAFNFRSFEIPATGSAMLTTHTEKQEEIFGDGAAYANDPEELLAEACRLLDNPDERERMAARGAERVEPHTIRARMERVIETL